MKTALKHTVSLAGMLACLYGGSAYAISITQDTNATNLANALGSTGITITSSSLSAAGATSSGTYTNASGTYGISSGVVLSTGNVNDYADGPNSAPNKTTDYSVLATAAQQALLGPISGESTHYDVAQLTVTFDVGATTDNVFFNVVFGSEEYREYVGSEFTDAFGIYLNGTNIATFNGLPVNIDHPNMAFVSGTELDGVLSPTASSQVMLFSGAVTPNSTNNTLTFIVADASDPLLDTTVYIAGFGNVNPGGGSQGGGSGCGTPGQPACPPPPPSVPEPSSVLLLGSGLAALVLRLRRHTEK